MRISEYKKHEIEKKKRQAVALYKTGLSTREVGRILGRSHDWVANAVRGLKAENTT